MTGSQPAPFFGVLAPALVDALIAAAVAWQRQRRVDGLPPDLGLLDFVTALAEARRGPAGTTFDAHPQTREHEPMHLLLTYRDTAARLAISERHVKRLVAAGTLPRVRIGAASRIHTDDLTRYLTTLRKAH